MISASNTTRKGGGLMVTIPASLNEWGLTTIMSMRPPPLRVVFDSFVTKCFSRLERYFR